MRAKRRFPKQVKLEKADDDAPRGRCCKVCIRKLEMHNIVNKSFRSGKDNDGLSFKAREELLKDNVKDLRRNVEELKKRLRDNHTW